MKLHGNTPLCQRPQGKGTSPCPGVFFRQKGRTEYYRGVPLSMNLLPKLQVDMVVSKVPVAQVVDAARKALYTKGRLCGDPNSKKSLANRSCRFIQRFLYSSPWRAS